MENQAETAVFSVSKIKKTTNKLCQCTKIYLTNYPTVLFKMLFQNGKIWSKNEFYLQFATSVENWCSSPVEASGNNQLARNGNQSRTSSISGSQNKEYIKKISF